MHSQGSQFSVIFEGMLHVDMKSLIFEIYLYLRNGTGCLENLSFLKVGLYCTIYARRSTRRIVIHRNTLNLQQLGRGRMLMSENALQKQYL